LRQDVLVFGDEIGEAMENHRPVVDLHRGPAAFSERLLRGDNGRIHVRTIAR
jgi:hypothetical protein